MRSAFDRLAQRLDLFNIPVWHLECAGIFLGNGHRILQGICGLDVRRIVRVNEGSQNDNDIAGPHEILSEGELARGVFHREHGVVLVVVAVHAVATDGLEVAQCREELPHRLGIMHDQLAERPRERLDDHVVAIVDGGPKIISFVVDGTLNDGGAYRQFGWGRFSPHLRGVDGADSLRIGPGVRKLRIYNRALGTSEAIANYRADSKKA